MKRILLSMIRFYQKWISPLGPARCRFYPTCSSYALEAVSRYGAIRGGLLSLWRILRCSPLCKGGIDPVPVLRCRPGRGIRKETAGRNSPNNKKEE